MDVLGGLVPLIVDAATGAWFEFDTNNVNVVLTPQAMSKKPLPSWALKVMKSRGLVIGQTAQ